LTDNENIDAGGEIAREIAMQQPGCGDADAGRAEELRRSQVEFLSAQSKLQGVQAEKLRAELHHLRAQDRNIAVANLRERLKLVLDAGLALVGLALIAVIGVVVYSAARAQSVIVDAFSVPPDFAAQGNSGVVVAGAFLDQLRTLQDATRSAAERHAIEDAWSHDIKVEIPDTGVSLGEAINYLRGWLGNDIHITGSVVHSGDTVVLNVRGSGFPGKSFAGKTSDLGKLTAQAAEYVYGQSEPYLFGVYLLGIGRDKEAIAFVAGIYGRVSKEQRVNLLTIWGIGLNNVGDVTGAIEKYREQINLDPQLWIAYGNLSGAQLNMGNEEGALQTADEMEAASRRIASNVPERFHVNQDYLRMDFPAEHRLLLDDMEANRGLGTASSQDAPLDAEALERMHESRAAELELQTSPGKGSDNYVVAESAYVRGLMEIGAKHFLAAYRAVSVADKMASRSPFVATNFFAPPSCLAGWLAEMTGQPAVADADIARGGHFEDCYRFKGDIADHRGNRPQALKDYAQAVALVPSMPAGYFSWGEALMRHRDYKDAVSKFVVANAKGPHWAEPLKRWGDALVEMGRSDLALAKYEEASKYAPRWGGLYIAWGRALDYTGRHDEAVTNYRAALTMDLTGDEHWSLRGCCG
jgi:tetratricopeptide (TPR) repeat protein